LEEEREREMDKLFAAMDEETNEKRLDDKMDEDINGQVQKSTGETLMAGEKIMEALDIADQDKKRFADYEKLKTELNGDTTQAIQPPNRNPIFSMYDDAESEEYVLRVIEKISPAALYDALLVLPFGKVCRLLEYVDHWTVRVRKKTFSDETRLIGFV
jgi:U3 small nucleolar RNA-associated protein 12